MREFRNQWLSGLQPILSLETASDGRIHVLFKVVAGDATGQREGAQHQGVDNKARCQAGKAQQHCRRSPSYRRRLLRRAAARAAAGEKSVQTDTEKCHQPVLPLPPISSPPQPDPAPTIVLAAEAEQLPQHHPQHLPLVPTLNL